MKLPSFITGDLTSPTRYIISPNIFIAINILLRCIFLVSFVKNEAPCTDVKCTHVQPRLFLWRVDLGHNKAAKLAGCFVLISDRICSYAYGL